MIFESDSSEEDEEITATTTLSTTELHANFLSSQQPFMPQDSLRDVVFESAEFKGAKSATLSNPYDKNSWIIMLSEAEKCGHKSTILEAFHDATVQFPRAATFWKRFTDLLIHFGEIQQAEDAFRKCLVKCRSVELWDSYLNLVRIKTVGQHPPVSEEYANTKKAYEGAFENAMENIGVSIDVNVIWRKYIDFVREWPDANESDSGRKLIVLRELYHRAISTPMEALDMFWREYEEWEMKAGKHLAEQLLPEFNKKYQDAKKIHRDRKRLYSPLDLSCIATPPSDGSIVEMKQLESWNELLKAESKNHYDYSEEQLKSVMDMTFDRFLACFFLHPEAWIMFSRYQLHFYSLEEARKTLKAAIVFIPDVPTLWMELAESEETSGDVDSAHETLRLCFEQNPSAFTFSILQKFIRRKEGKAAARKLFSNTIMLREEGVLGLETFVAHASLELHGNNEADVALRVLEAAKERVPTAYSNLAYIKILTDVLVRLGDFRQLRWIYETNIGQLECEESSKKLRVEHKFKAEDELSLWEGLLEAELSMGMSDARRLKLLQEKVRSTRASYEKRPFVSLSKIDLFEPIQHLHARYENIAVSLFEGDAALKGRISSVLFKDMTEKGDYSQRDKTIEGNLRKRKKASDEPAQAAVELTGVPIFLRDLLAALPSHPSGTGPHQGTDVFIDQLRRTVLPPRPVSEKSHGSNDSSMLGLHSQQLPNSSGSKRKSEDLSDFDHEDIRYDGSHDVFRQRRRSKLNSN